MSFKGYFFTLAAAFSNGWVDETSGKALTPISWPNVAFTKPSNEPWVRFGVLDGSSSFASAGAAGNNIVRHVGQVVIQIFVPVMTAETKARELADVAAGLFSGVRLDSGHIRFGTAYMTPVPNSLDDGWHQVNVTIPFQRDEYR